MRVLYVAALTTLCVVTNAAAGDDYETDRDATLVQYNLMVPMRDGVKLATDVHRPAAQGRYPVILVRNPYDNGGEPQWLEAARSWTQRGYVFVFQNVRGRVDSQGEFYPYLSEAEDGYDAQQWAAAQSWSNGRVGTLGQSYSASTQWLSAHLRAPALRAMAPIMTPFNYYSDVAYVGGALSLGSRIGWASLMGGRTNQQQTRDWPRLLQHLPLRTLDAALGTNLPHWRDWIAHPGYDDYWKKVDVASRVDDIDVPSYNVGGWYDVFLRGTVTSYVAMTQRARSEVARRGQKLLIGPWRHTIRPTRQLGELDFGPESVLDIEAQLVPWFDQWLKGDDPGAQDEPPVRLFVMGANRWRSEQEWPLARTRYTKYYLRSAGRANSVHGDGKLALDLPGKLDRADHYVYDPRNPVPTRGGALMFVATPAGPYDQTEIEQRDDVLVYSSEPLEKDTEVTGPITVTLYAQSTAADTDFTAKLVDVHPDGKSYNLADGIIRARYRESFEAERLLEPDEVYEFTIDLWATSNLFKRGHRLRVEVSSSNFPRFDRNPNTGHTSGSDVELRSARQTVYHSKKYPSHITLPVIPR